MGILALIPTKYHVEIVPFTNRAHLVCSPRASRAVSELFYAAFKKKHASAILPVDHEITVRVNRILSNIIRTIYLSLVKKTQEEEPQPLDWSAAGLDWEVIVLQDDRIKAACWVGSGKIIVCRGLLDRFHTDEEITAILAHEVGHAIARHSSEMILRFLAILFPKFLLLPLIRRRELEADYIGMLLLAACGFDPHIAPRTLDKLGMLKREGIFTRLLYFLKLTTHPPTKKRSKLLSRPKAMEEAMRLYAQVTSRGLARF